MLWASRGGVDNLLGRIIHRTTRACIMGLIEAVRSDERKEGIVVVDWRETM